MKQPIKMTPGDELHLTALMAPFSLNLVTGQDRQHLLGYGRAAFEAGQKTTAAGQCLHQIQEPAPVLVAPQTRFCPECGHVGEVGAGHRDCCPDGSAAFMVPEKHAHDLRAGFIARLSAAPAAMAVPDERAAFEQAFIAEKLRLMDCSEPESATHAIRMCHLKRYEDGEYPTLEAYFAWFAWQARAALAATPAAAPDSESVLIYGTAYDVPAAVAGELLRLHLEILAVTLAEETRTSDAGLKRFLRAANDAGITHLPKSFGKELREHLETASAPVVLPEPFALYDGEKWYANEEAAICSCANMQKLQKVYTEQQVRALLATGGQAQAVERGEVLVTVSGFTGSGKSAIAGEIEILCRALGLQVEWPDGDSEKNMTHADWTAALEQYKPRVHIVEQNIPFAAMKGMSK